MLFIYKEERKHDSYFTNLQNWSFCDETDTYANGIENPLSYPKTLVCLCVCLSKKFQFSNNQCKMNLDESERKKTIENESENEFTFDFILNNKQKQWNFLPNILVCFYFGLTVSVGYI